jgi:hypothetical protein
MRRISAWITALWMLSLPGSLCGQAGSSSSAKPEAGLETNYSLVNFLPSYRFVNTSGFGGRVGEYDSLNQSVGGDLSLTQIDLLRRYSVKYRGEFITRDDYDMDSELRWGQYFSLTFAARSFVRHLDNFTLGVNLSPDDIVRSEGLPADALFGVKRTNNVLNARFKVPHSVLTFFLKAGWMARRGDTQMQYYDMGGDSQCGSCHSVSQFRQVNYTTRNVAGGFEVKLRSLVLAYQHQFTSFRDRLPNPASLYGSTLSLPDDALPAGVPDTVMGLYVHNVFPAHQTETDSLRLNATLSPGLSFNGNISDARIRNEFTGNPQNSFNADSTLSWTPLAKLRTWVDFHEQNTLNGFTPVYALFGNPSIHRFWTSAHAEYRLKPWLAAETYYRRTNVTRSNANLWPQFYSPDAAALLGSPANAFTPLVVPKTFSNTLGTALRFGHTEHWNLRTGYEWVGTHAPGYLTEPGTSHRAFVSGSLSPYGWLVLSNDLSLLRQHSFPGIQRDNRMYTETSYVTLKPVALWSVAFGYSYFHEDLRSDLFYASDPVFYGESMVPFKAISQSGSVSTSYLVKRRLALNLEFSHVVSHSDFRPGINPDLPDQNAPVLWAAQFSRVDVPQALLRADAEYRWAHGLETGLRLYYGSYTDRVNPTLSGKLRSYSTFFGRVW